MTHKKYWSEIIDCNCHCHDKGNSIIHIVACCDNGKKEIRHYIQTDSEKLELLATWHDSNDKLTGNKNNEVQNDLRRIAKYLRKDSQSEIESLREENESLKRASDYLQGYAQKNIAECGNLYSKIKELESKIEELDKFHEGSLQLSLIQLENKEKERLEQIHSKNGYIIKLKDQIEELESKLAERDEDVDKLSRGLLANVKKHIGKGKLSPKEEEQD